MPDGTIKKLVHLSTQTDIPSANLSAGHNYHGYGYIETAAGDKVYFEHSAVENRRFDDLSEGCRVDFKLDPAEPQRATSVSPAAG